MSSWTVSPLRPSLLDSPRPNAIALRDLMGGETLLHKSGTLEGNVG